VFRDLKKRKIARHVDSNEEKMKRNLCEALCQCLFSLSSTGLSDTDLTFDSLFLFFKRRRLLGLILPVCIYFINSSELASVLSLALVRRPSVLPLFLTRSRFS
jgi:hypothetical protein